jgi:hypothetical protein
MFYHKDLLLLLCDHLDVHSCHCFMLTCKRVFEATQSHRYRTLRSAMSCFVKGRNWLLRHRHNTFLTINGRQRYEDYFWCVKCKLWFKSDQIHTNVRCQGRATAYVHVNDWGRDECGHYCRCGFCGVYLAPDFPFFAKIPLLQ